MKLLQLTRDLIAAGPVPDDDIRRNNHVPARVDRGRGLGGEVESAIETGLAASPCGAMRCWRKRLD
jgi:hypothetical protein